MSIISMAVYDTAENKRTDYTKQTLYSLLRTVDFKKHRLYIGDNGSCEATHKVLKSFERYFVNVEHYPPENLIIEGNGVNIGTANAVNKGFALRTKEDVGCVKMDNDVVIHQAGWLDIMEEAVKRNPRIGIIGLKRKDLEESPLNENENYRSQLFMLNHKRGERWIVVEKVNHVIGTCQMYSAALLDKIGFLYQPSVYAWDDALAAVRCELAGFVSCFLPHIEIDHIDDGSNPFTKWKTEHAGKYIQEFAATAKAYRDGTMSIYFDGKIETA